MVLSWLIDGSSKWRDSSRRIKSDAVGDCRSVLFPHQIMSRFLYLSLWGLSNQQLTVFVLLNPKAKPCSTHELLPQNFVLLSASIPCAFSFFKSKLVQCFESRLLGVSVSDELFETLTILRLPSADEKPCQE